jgi:hypothetical protein
MPTARVTMQVAKDSMSGNKSRFTVVGGTVVGGMFGWDTYPITKWILLEEILPNPEEGD